MYIEDTAVYQGLGGVPVWTDSGGWQNLAV